jgi:hypothetical protein
MDEKLEARLRNMADREEIRQVLMRYARGLDRLDNTLARSCYWDDAIEDHSHFVGSPDDFIVWADSTTLMFESTQHGILNHFCDLQGDDAYCETYFLFSGVAKSPPHLLSTGRYIDHFQRRNGEWRIASRVTIVEGQFALADSDLGKDMPPAYGPDEIYPATRDGNDVSYQRPLRPRQPRRPQTR